VTKLHVAATLLVLFVMVGFSGASALLDRLG